MNREYAYNRDKGESKICRCYLESGNRYCYRVNEKLPIEVINKVSNLVWLCKECDEYVHGNELPKGLNNSKIKKIEKYKAKLN